MRVFSFPPAGGSGVSHPSVPLLLPRSPFPPPPPPPPLPPPPATPTAPHPACSQPALPPPGFRCPVIWKTPHAPPSPAFVVCPPPPAAIPRAWCTTPETTLPVFFI